MILEDLLLTMSPEGALIEMGNSDDRIQISCVDELELQCKLRAQIDNARAPEGK